MKKLIQGLVLVFCLARLNAGEFPRGSDWPSKVGVALPTDLLKPSARAATVDYDTNPAPVVPSSIVADRSVPVSVDSLLSNPIVKAIVDRTRSLATSWERTFDEAITRSVDDGIDFISFIGLAVGDDSSLPSNIAKALVAQARSLAISWETSLMKDKSVDDDDFSLSKEVCDVLMRTFMVLELTNNLRDRRSAAGDHFSLPSCTDQALARRNFLVRFRQKNLGDTSVDSDDDSYLSKIAVEILLTTLANFSTRHSIKLSPLEERYFNELIKKN
jgi:hypothetical protein